MSNSHKASLVLSGLAFLTFVANQWAAFIGWHLELTGPIGATVLSLFLAAGLCVQVWKWIEGNKTVLDFLINLVMIPAHVYAELSIWFRTQIADLGLSVDLPLYIIGLYWVIGLVEILVSRLGHNLAMLKGKPGIRDILFRKARERDRSIRQVNSLFGRKDAPVNNSGPYLILSVGFNHLKPDLPVIHENLLAHPGISGK